MQTRRKRRVMALRDKVKLIEKQQNNKYNMVNGS